MQLRSLTTAPVLLVIACAAAATVAFVACGGDDAKPSATGTPIDTQNASQTDVCTLVTFQEVSAALGETIADRAATTPPVRQQIAPGLEADLSACQYSSPTSGAFVQIDLSEAKGRAAKIKEFTQGVCANKDEIAGLGDFACWYSFDHREIKLAKNGAHIDIKSGTLTNDALRALAEKAIARLP